jgi:hypothetical protein
MHLMKRVAYAPVAMLVGIMLTAGTTAAQNQGAHFFVSESPAAHDGSIAADPNWRFVMFRLYGARKAEADGRWILEDAE